MNSEPSILISLLNWNNAPDTISAVKSILSTEYPNYTLIIIDNASVDNSVNEIKVAFPNLKIIETKTNLGYAGGHKLVADIAVSQGFDAIWILNNDALVFPDSLSTLVHEFNTNPNALYGSITLKSDGATIGYGGGVEMSTDCKILEDKGYNQYANRLYNEVKDKMITRNTSDLNGASIFIPTKIISKYGFIDTSWFLYGEETDYCYALRNRHKVLSYVVPQSIIVHSGSASFKKSPMLSLVKDYYFTRNIQIIHKKHYPHYRITGHGGYKKLLIFFIKHYLFYKRLRSISYWKEYYTNLGYLHALLRLRGKYMKPEKFIEK